MGNVSILTCNFNGYDLFRTHFISPVLDYLYITDGPDAPAGWKHVYFSGGDPWYSCMYVRYHPFEFTGSEYAVVIDGSLSSNSSIESLVDCFVGSRCDLGVLLSHEPMLLDRISKWEHRHRITHKEACRLYDLLKRLAHPYYMGTVAGAVRLYRNTGRTRQYLEKCWDLLFDGPDIARLDEVPSTLALELVDGLDIMPFSTHLIQGDVFQYHSHGGDAKVKLPFNRTKFWLMDKKATPVFIGDEYHRKFRYRSEIMCLTRYLDAAGLKEWLDHHLALGVGHIHIFDNESPYDCKGICTEYGDRVSYEFVPGYARHYRLYDGYVNGSRCQSEWIMAIDDDEYLELNPAVCSTVENCIEWYESRFPGEHMFAIRWKHMFPKKFHTECPGKILDYCTEENPSIAAMFQPMGDRGVKSLVHRIGKIHYEELEENPTGGHVPRHPLCNGARMFNGELVVKCSCNRVTGCTDEPARLIHCRYKGYSWYRAKYLEPDSPSFCYGNCSGTPYIKRYRFNEIIEELD